MKSDHIPDHPRSRGVYASALALRALSAGSSPLARGLQHPVLDGDHVNRIIPARAGFTTRRSLEAMLFEDHPRSRGVYDVESPETSLTPGSSPLARGLHFDVIIASTVDRIIPARAGFTVRARRVGRVESDHPRSRGVYPWTAIRTKLASGSSPLARGLLVNGFLCRNRSGIIPARAGFTRGRRR